MSDTTSEAASPSPSGRDRAVPPWLVRSAAWTWRLLLLLVAGLALLWLMARLMVVSLPVLVAIIVSTLAVPPAHWLRQRGLKPAGAAAIVVVGGLGVIVGLLAVLAPSIGRQLSELGPTLADAWDSVLTWLETGPLAYDRAEVEQLLSNAQGMLSDGGGGGVVSGVLSGAAMAAQAVTGLLLFVVLLFFFVKDGDEIVQWFVARTSPAYRPTLRAVGARAWTALSGYVRGTAFIAVIDALGIMVGLLLLDVPLVAPLTLLTFFGAFIPVIGAFTAGLLSVLVALAAGGLLKAALVLAVVVGVQQVEGNLLQPMVMRRAVALHPVVILVALGAGAALAGIIGAFLAVPVTAVVAAVGNELRLRAEADRPYTDPEAPAEPLGPEHADAPTAAPAEDSSGPGAGGQEHGDA